MTDQTEGHLKIIDFGQQERLAVQDDMITEPTVLVVDDDKKDLRQMVTLLSKNLEATLFQATNLEDAIEILHNQYIDLLVSDIVMPEFRMTEEMYYEWVEANPYSHDYTVARELGWLGNGGKTMRTAKTRSRKTLAGFKLLEEARKIIPWLPVIVVTQFADFEMAREALRHNVEEIFSKTELDRTPNILAKKATMLISESRQTLAKFNRSEFLKAIRQLDEKDFTQKVLMPLLHNLGCRGIRYTHGTNECGIDLLFHSVDPLGRTRYTGAQVKVENVIRQTGSRESSNLMRILDQAYLALESRFNVTRELGDIELDRFLVITSQSINDPARKFIQESVKRRLPGARIDWIDGDDLADLILTTPKGGVTDLMGKRRKRKKRVDPVDKR